MPQLLTEDGKYLFVDDVKRLGGDGNHVTYRMNSDGTIGPAVWNSVDDEAGMTIINGPPPEPSPDAPPPINPADHPPRFLRVTDERDGDLVNRGYSYWPQAVIRHGAIWAFAGHVDEHPKFFSVDLATGEIHRHGSLVHYRGTGEGWYFDAAARIYLCDGAELHRVDPFTGDDVIIFTIEASHPGCRLWQCHSSTDGQTHSATVQRIVSDGPYENIGTVVVYHGQQEYYPAKGVLDESAITSDGSYLIIKEDDDNRVITLGTRDTRMMRNADGALGHSDVGPGYVVGEDDQHGECVLYDLSLPLVPERRKTLLKTWNLGHVSVRGGRCLRADHIHLSLIMLDGSGEVILGPHGMVSDGTYDTQVFANLSPDGSVYAYLSNAAGRLDLYVGRL